MAAGEVGSGHVRRRLSDEERADLCAHIRATVNQLDGVSTNVAHQTIDDLQLQRVAYELTDLSRRLIGLAGRAT